MTPKTSMTPDSKPTKDRILDAAIHLFSQRGYTAVSVREITREVGIKESSLYNHFSNKEEILDTIFHNFRPVFARMLPPVELLDQILARSTPEMFLRQGLQNFRNNISDPTFERVFRILQMEQYRHAIASEIILKDMVEDTLDFLEIVFAKYIARGEIKPLDPRMLAAEYQYAVFAMTTEYNILKFQERDTSGIEARMERHLQFFLENVRA